jgi:UDP-N-acetylglucosamine 2-epimerase (non-hydrolysing)
MVITCVVGTRPEAIKMAPVILMLRRGLKNQVRVLASGQHRLLLDRALADFGLQADHGLELMRPNQQLADLSARALTALSDDFERHRPGLVLAQGDTTTVFCAALAAYYRRIPFGHVEAGLRTGRKYFPYPEEKNRVLTSHLADEHFAPTSRSRSNLLHEGIDDANIHVTGNTVIDALLLTTTRNIPMPVTPSTERYLLVTAHRRENFGEPFRQICLALRDLVDHDRYLSIVYPVHPNPNVKNAVDLWLAGHDRIHLIEPIGYPEFVALMKGAYALVTDSGGVQEEAPALGKPVLVLRDETERPEAVAAGTVQLIGPHRERIVDAVRELCENPTVYERFARAVNPYGDGRAADRIGVVLASRYGVDCGVAEETIPGWPRSS